MSESPSGSVTTAQPPSLVGPPTTTTVPPAVVDVRRPGSTTTTAPLPTNGPAAGVSRSTTAPVPPPPFGTYRYDTTGHSSYPVLGGTAAPYPAVTTLVVEPATGTRQHARRDLKDTSGNGPIIETRFDYRADGVYLESLRLTVAVLVFSDSQEFRPPSPTLVLPTGAGPGYSQEQAVPGRAVPARLLLEVLGEERVRVGGQDVRTSAVRLTATTTGQFNARMQLTIWLDRATGVWAKERSVSEARSPDGALLYQSEYEATLQRLAPA